MRTVDVPWWLWVDDSHWTPLVNSPTDTHAIHSHIYGPESTCAKHI